MLTRARPSRRTHGATTEVLTGVLEEHVVDYLFTDQSPYFCPRLRARHKISGYSLWQSFTKGGLLPRELPQNSRLRWTADCGSKDYLRGDPIPKNQEKEALSTSVTPTGTRALFVQDKAPSPDFTLRTPKLDDAYYYCLARGRAGRAA